MTALVKAPDFLADNYLSTDFRIPVTLLQTNACSPLATNAIRGNIWDNFSSETYKDLPSVGSVTVYDPVTGAPRDYKMPGGGRGFTRPPTLISLWSTAPYLLNNSVGDFDPEPSVEGRMRSFESSIRQLLWPETRAKDSVLGDKVPGVIDRMTKLSYVHIAPGFVPEFLKGWGPWLLPNFFQQEGLDLGPIPRGTPVGLLTNLLIRPEELGLWERLKHDRELATLFFDTKKRLHELGPPPPPGGDEEEYNRRAQEIFTPLAGRLMALSKCPDYVVNRGHYFGTGYNGEPALSGEDKGALIEFMKTF